MAIKEPQNYRILITDDDPSIRQTMEAIVRQAGMRSIAVATGEEALKCVQTSAVDVMLLDVQLPGINGLEVLKQVRDKQPDIGVIMLSVIKEIPIAVQAIQLGAHDYVQKDFSPVELAASLRSPAVRQLAIRATGLSAEALATLTQMVEHVRQLEGLDTQATRLA